MAHIKEKYLNHQDILSVIRKIDRNLEGYQRKFRLYCIGGTYLAFSGIDESSKDIDFILSHEDFRALSGIIAEIELKDKIRIDLFPDGEMPNFKLPNYDGHSSRVLSLDHLNVYKIDMVDFVLIKAIAGRVQDYKDIEKLVKDKSLMHKEKLIERFNELEIAKNKEDDIKRKFWAFIDEFYR